MDTRISLHSRGSIFTCLSCGVVWLSRFTLAIFLLFQFSSAAYAKTTDDFTFTPPPQLVNIGKIDNSLFQNGYLDVTLYDGWQGHDVDPTGVKDSTVALQKALDDAHDYRLTAYFPAGTYLISDTLHFVKKYAGSLLHRYSTTLVGSTQGRRPIIKLKNNASGFNDPNNIKPVLAVWRKRTPAAFGTPGNQLGDPEIKGEGKTAWHATGYLQRIQGIEVHCGKGNAGAVGLLFRAAQDSHIEDVRVVATGAFAGFYGIPSRTSAGAANIEVEGGQYGIYLPGDAGSVIVGALLRNQTVEAIHTEDFVPIAVVGFKIVKSRGPVVRIINYGADNVGTLSLVDGIVELTDGGEAFNNEAGKNFYLRNVYVRGASTLVKVNHATPLVTGQWARIVEYAYTQRNARSFNLIDESKHQNETKTIVNQASPPPSDLIARHIWNRLPSFEETSVINAADFGATGNDVSDDTQAIQRAIDRAASTSGKVFLPKGEFLINQTLNLHSNTQFFGVARHLTWIRSAASWKPTQLTPMIQTVNDPEAITYLGHLAIRYESGNDAHDWFNPVSWRAGRNSRVVGIYTWASGVGGSTQPRVEFYISGHGGGHWYFMGRHQRKAHTHPLYRHVLIEGTHQPLWWYGMNLEKPTNSDFNAEIDNAANIRIFGVKVEGKERVMKVNNSTNVAVISGGAMRQPPSPLNGAHYDVTGSSQGILMANINPQNQPPGDAGDHTIRDVSGTGIVYPGMVGLFKRGTIDDSVMIQK